jgi:hypothetical protein
VWTHVDDCDHRRKMENKRLMDDGD